MAALGTGVRGESSASVAPETAFLHKGHFATEAGGKLGLFLQPLGCGQEIKQIACELPGPVFWSSLSRWFLRALNLSCGPDFGSEGSPFIKHSPESRWHLLRCPGSCVPKQRIRPGRHAG